MSNARVDRITALLGAEHVRASDGGGVRVTPPNTDAMAGMLGLAYDEGWRIAIAGSGSWQSELPPVELVVSTRGLDDAAAIAVHDGTVTVPAGVGCDALRQGVTERGAWVVLDPPGRPARTIGSVLATATSGPLRAGFGPLRDRVVALTVVTADGRVLRPTRNGAIGSPESIRPHVGGFGGFGVITEATLEVHGDSRSDTTWIARGTRDQLTATARELAVHHLAVAAAELISPALATEPEWLLAVRCIGSAPLVAEQGAQLGALTAYDWQELAPDRQALLWNGSARGHSTLPVTIRLAVLPEGIDEAIDMLVAELGEGMLSAGGIAGMIRWSGDATADRIRGLRAEFAARESPLTVERAPWGLLRSVGHSGVYREGMDGPLERLRTQHDPGNILVTAIIGEQVT